jgi:hypothetical protein
MTDFYKVNPSLTTSAKIELLNDMILALEGKIEKAEFNKNEVDALYSDLGSSYQHKFLRNQSLGHTLATYTGWTHVKAESGYSIWKFTPTTYTYNALNRVYFDDKIVENKGQATSETAESFFNVQMYDGASGGGNYTDNTTEAGTEEGTGFDLMEDTDDYLYIGDTNTFTGMKLEFETRGSNYTLVAEYYNGTSWVELDLSGRTYEDNTSNFESDGRIEWSLPDDWATVAINSVTKYFIRLSTTTVPVTVAKAYYLIPGASVPSLLALSSTEFFNEEWKWCEYDGDIYMTIRNTGNSAYEGDYFLTSASSAANKQAFWIDNHEVVSDYQDSTY